MLFEIDEILRPEAIVLLRWLAYGERFMSLNELAQVVAIEIDSIDNSVSINYPGDPEDILHILGALVTISAAPECNCLTGLEHRTSIEFKLMHTGRATDRDDEVCFAHSSIKEYLESNHFSHTILSEFQLRSDEGHRYLVRSCLAYLDTCMLHYKAIISRRYETGI